MISFWVIYPGVLIATLVPAYAALSIVPALRAVSARYLAAAGVGLSLWYFFDTAGDAAALGENNALYPPSLFGGLPHLALIGTFVLGVATLAVFDAKAVPGKRQVRGSLFLVPAAVALVMGVHSFGEGWDVLSAVSTGPPSSATGLQALVQAFGTYPAVISYPLHKFLEASIVGILYVAYVTGRAGSNRRLREISILGILFGGPTAVGAALGYLVSFDTTYFFAFGMAAAMYAILRLGEYVARGTTSDGSGPAYYGPKVFAALATGMLLLFVAALLH